MKLRRRYDDLASEVSKLAQQHELLLAQMSEEKAEWEKLHKVCFLQDFHDQPRLVGDSPVPISCCVPFIGGHHNSE